MGDGTKLRELGTAELPEPPVSTWHIVGPGIVAAGVGLASGEFILYPFIASQVGLVFVWAAFVGLITQFFINMEIERYTLATGETVLTGFSRLGRHWGLFFVLLAMLANLWPGWATSAATLTTYLVGGSVAWIATGILIAIGAILTLSPVVYRALDQSRDFFTDCRAHRAADERHVHGAGDDRMIADSAARVDDRFGKS
jgi:hypothetical protein